MNKIKQYYVLLSVGYAIDEDGFTYPMFESGIPDLSNPYHIEDIYQDEWFDALSQNDIDKISKIKKAYKVR